MTRNNKALYEQGDSSMPTEMNLQNSNGSHVKKREEKGSVDRKGT